MTRLLLLLALIVTLVSCGSSRKPTETQVIGTPNATISNKKIDKIVRYAKTFEGTRYKFGGTDTKGMDCSGLVYTSFKKESVALPRVSREMAKKGVRISLNETAQGDLVFFQTNKNRRVINHVGLVVRSRKGVIHFIHATTSRGVIISSLDESYWNDAFVEARRII